MGAEEKWHYVTVLLCFVIVAIAVITITKIVNDGTTKSDLYRYCTINSDAPQCKSLK